MEELIVGKVYQLPSQDFVYEGNLMRGGGGGGSSRLADRGYGFLIKFGM